ncbi:MAG: 3-deoxy-8-phosphooctulonate synthase [Weizmannia coagulans]|jgi:2-dehydro-3-deoxyphosphooctonate aldolase (KDO 8-P synthase)|nr:3-deoxy-8-phosphooctulonate synthase [Heyndrickxia coagulans]
MKTVQLNSRIAFGQRLPLVLIAGPCVIESETMAMETAATLQTIAGKLGIPFVFKASFDKANRSSIFSKRGPGLEKGLEILDRIKNVFGVPVTSDIHEPHQAKAAGEVLDILQIPAFLCRQTDLLLAAAATGKIVNVKKGQFLAPWDMKNVIQKLEESGTDKILLTERGSTFGYNNLVVDMRALPEMRRLGYPVVFDATHSVQIPGGNGTSTGGERAFVPYLARAAAACGIDALFLEAHPDPDQAWSDGPNMVKLDDLEEMLKPVIEIDRMIKEQTAANIH